MIKQFLKRSATIAFSGLLLTTLAAPAHAEKSFTMAATAPASSTGIFSVALSEILKKKYGYHIQISNGTAATRQAVEAANHRLDLFVTAVSINHYMSNQLAMFKKKDDSKELFKNLRAIINYPFGAYQPIVWESSGIKTFKDIKGKKVFTGPPSGAARTSTEGIVEGVTGYKPNVDYERVNLDWSSAQQAFRDHQIDVYFLPATIPSPQLEELSAMGKFRIVSVPESALDSPGIKKATEIPGRVMVMVPPKTYANQMNAEPARVLQSIVGLGATKWMSEKDAYDITRAIFENKADLVAAGKWMQSITPQSALENMNMPLHKGAAKYFREIGVKIPASAQPVD